MAICIFTNILTQLTHQCLKFYFPESGTTFQFVFFFVFDLVNENLPEDESVAKRKIKVGTF